MPRSLTCLIQPSITGSVAFSQRCASASEMMTMVSYLRLSLSDTSWAILSKGTYAMRDAMALEFFSMTSFRSAGSPAYLALFITRTMTLV